MSARDNASGQSRLAWRQPATAPDMRTGRSRSARRRGGRARSDALTGYAMITPTVVMIGLLALLPVGITIAQSLFRVDPVLGPSKYIGLGNYSAILHTADFQTAFQNTLLYTVFGVVISMLLGLVFAVALQGRVKASGVLLALAMLPWALPGVVAGVIWSWIYDPNFGVLNSFLKSAHLIGHYQIWVGTHAVEEILVISLVQVWQFTPLATVIILASLQAIPGELYEAADIDGASAFRKIRRITLPLARPGITVALIESIITATTIFDPVYVLNQNSLSGESLVSTVYYTTFQNLNFGQGYAFSVVLTIAIIVLSALAAAITYRKVEF
jgi:multiple sugar transport system permease protein